MSDIFPVGQNEHTSGALNMFHAATMNHFNDKLGPITSNEGKRIGKKVARSGQFKSYKEVETNIDKKGKELQKGKITDKQYEEQVKGLRKQGAIAVDRMVFEAKRLLDKSGVFLPANKGLLQTENFLNMPGGDPSLATFGKEANVIRDNQVQEYLNNLGLPAQVVRLIMSYVKTEYAKHAAGYGEAGAAEAV